MTTATLIPLHTQTFINELLLEEREPLVSVKHTWVLLMSSLSTHTVVSLSALGHSPAPRFKLTPHSPKHGGGAPLCQCLWWKCSYSWSHYLNHSLVSTEAPMFLEEKYKAPALAAGTLFLSAAGIERDLESVWFLMDGYVSRLALCALAGPNPGPKRPLAVSFIQFCRLPTGNEGFRGQW